MDNAKSLSTVSACDDTSWRYPLGDVIIALPIRANGVDRSNSHLLELFPLAHFEKSIFIAPDSTISHFTRQFPCHFIMDTTADLSPYRADGKLVNITTRHVSQRS